MIESSKSNEKFTSSGGDGNSSDADGIAGVRKLNEDINPPSDDTKSLELI